MFECEQMILSEGILCAVIDVYLELAVPVFQK